MPQSITKSIDIDFAHNVHGHKGACLSIHGHTWKFELTMESDDLNNEGFVLDFKDLKNAVLAPVHKMLDHGYAVYHDTLFTHSKLGNLPPMIGALEMIGQRMIATRTEVHGTCDGHMPWLFGVPLIHEGTRITPKRGHDTLCGAFDINAGGCKVVSFPFPPTSERLAKWLYDVASTAHLPSAAKGTRVTRAAVYETLHPVESVAVYSPPAPSDDHA